MMIFLLLFALCFGGLWLIVRLAKAKYVIEGVAYVLEEYDEERSSQYEIY